MILIQILLVLLILLIISRLVVRFRNKQFGLFNFLLWLVFWIAGASIILYPEASSYIARVLGVGRGADVVIYISLVLIFYFIFYITVRLRVIEQQITRIVRKISLDKDEKNHTKT
ncbi:DUF2304 domain-containing protein [Patescibacteria group bacterium AH-259-L05]|nr:DUF2304 domain-containing protein [Patescibacteria group bacterium AH-259-L05]